jgi:hypothetical protein
MPRRVFAYGISLGLLAGVLGLQAWLLDLGPLAVDCPLAGNIDQVSIDSDGMQLELAGWASGPGVGKLSVRQGRRELARIARTPRTDVAARFQGCGPALDSGFFLRIPLSRLEREGGPITFRIEGLGDDSVEINPSRIPPFGAIHSREALRWDNRNVVSGWAIVPEGAATVKLVADGKVIAERRAESPSSYVADVFRGWPTARRAGFEFVLSMHELPRGRFATRIVIEGTQGERSELAGPPIEHDEAWGNIVAPEPKYLNPRRVPIVAWMRSLAPIEKVEVVDELDHGLGLLALRDAHAPYAATKDPGLRYRTRVPDGTGALYAGHAETSRLSPGVHRVRVRVDAGGRPTYLPGPLVVVDGKAKQGACAGEPFRVFYPGWTTLFQLGFPELPDLAAMVSGPCVQVGIRSRVEYLRTTRGRAEDFRFDPDFPEKKRVVDGHEMMGDSLRTVFQAADKWAAPLLVTLDGGVWANARFAAPELDIVDNLLEDERAVQWNQWGKSEPRDALKGLTGSFDDPQLARMMSLNRYNTRFREYKKRNLQSAVKAIVGYMRRHPGRYVAINLEPDNYINPWFTQTQWYDYNPDTLRQFREWLFHLGPYADGGELAASAYLPRLTLDDANRLAGREWKRIEEVDPPRASIDYQDPWQQAWTQFKRHLVAQHYADLAAWAVEAGMPRERIYTALGINNPDIAVTLHDRAHGWMDQAGVSIAGGKPPAGQLGVVLYGATARNEGVPRSGLSLFDDLRSTDPRWGAVEFHPASLVFREKLPSEAESYRAMRELLNGGAHLLSPMHGSYAVERELFPQTFHAYDAMEGSTFEYELVWWLREWRNRPAGSLFFPFGNPLVASDDGWKPGKGTDLAVEPGRLRLRSPGGEAALDSPQWSGISHARPATLVVEGSWTGRASAALEFSDGSTWQSEALIPGEAIAIPGRPGSFLSRIHLAWEGPEDIVLDSVAWTPRP